MEDLANDARDGGRQGLPAEHVRVASDAAAELLTLAEKMSIPVATSLNAKTAIPWDHPLAVGVCGSYSRECANRALAEADLIFFGSPPNAFLTI